MATSTAAKKPNASRKTGGRKAPAKPPTKDQVQDAVDLTKADPKTLTPEQRKEVASTVVPGLTGKALDEWIATGKGSQEQEADGRAAKAAAKASGTGNTNGHAGRASDDMKPLTKDEKKAIKTMAIAHRKQVEEFLAKAPKGDVRTGLLRMRQSAKQTIAAL